MSIFRAFLRGVWVAAKDLDAVLLSAFGPKGRAAWALLAPLALYVGLLVLAAIVTAAVQVVMALIPLAVMIGVLWAFWRALTTPAATPPRRRRRH